LTHQREGEGTIRKHPDAALQPLVAPHQDVDLVARVDPVGDACWGGLARLLCTRRAGQAAREQRNQQCK
jgi:hypothetical protein